MAQRLVRAEAQDQGRRDPVPGPSRSPAAGPARRGARGRLSDLQRGLSAAGASWRTRRSGSGWSLSELMPDEPEVHGLLAMMLLLHARREARFRGGELVLLADQDHSLWDQRRDRRRAGSARPRAGLRGRGPYVVQAAIASLHADEPRDWRADRRPVRRARAPHRLSGRRAEQGGGGGGGRRGPRPVSRSSIGSSSRTTATCTRLVASCCAGLGRAVEARDAYRRALSLVHDDAERRLLERRLAELGAS